MVSTNTSKNKIKDFLYAYTNDLELEDSIAELAQILLFKMPTYYIYSRYTTSQGK